ncbi:MAG: NUDIX domain-containing protein [Actinomycetia bacterium]|nr:NUDIX domain-containing protein [Actinomycetes bacterium]MCP4223572.1 NUDIX domain-containing protein [Actinomycetes bacterium]MCP5035407.1 NUDIX domain-containing protein [Actinomycetes bacterium]
MQVRRSRLSVYAWIERDGFVLLSKIAPGYASAGQWTLPGGDVEWGEHPEDSLHRELYEETGLKGSIGEQLGIDSAVHEPSEFNGFATLHIVRIIYRMAAEGTPQVIEIDGSSADAAWLPLSNIGDLPTVDLVSQGQSLAAGNGIKPGS